MWEIDVWDPLPIDDVAALLNGAPFRWWVSGGRALELHVGRSWRSHEDTDVGVLGSEVSRVAKRLSGWELAVAAGGRLSGWHGRPLQPGENNVWAGRTAWEIDFTVGADSDDEWVYRRYPAIRRPWSAAVLLSARNVPYLAPELQLLFKSKTARPKDHDDAEVVIPVLGRAARAFLEENLPAGHAWRRLLHDAG
ncbi:MAG: amino acid transporter [Acidimicrobiia bacterium]